MSLACKRLALAGAALFFSSLAQAFPNQERPANPDLKPLPLALDTQADAITVSPDDRWVVVNATDKIVLIDTASWELASVQPETLEASVGGFEFLANSESLFVYTSNGFITRILADDPLEDVREVDLSDKLGSGAGPVVVDPEDSGHLYFLNQSSRTIFEYDVGESSTIASVQLEASSVNDMVYVPLPAAGGGGGETDKILVTTGESTVFVLDEALNNVSVQEITLNGAHPDCIEAKGNRNLVAVSLSPEGDRAYILDATELTVHVFDTINNVEVDTDANAEGVNPICLHQIGPGNIDRDINSAPKDLLVTRVQEPENALRLYVAGSQGLTVIEAESPFDFIDQDEGTDEIDSIALSRKPFRIAASSPEDGYIYTANTDGSISVISDNPFVTISEVNPASLTEQTPNFTVSFQVDEVCNGCQYRVRAGGDIKESGSLLFTGTFTEADLPNTTLTTPPIDATQGNFEEGKNTLLIFVDDAAGNTGRDSTQLTVDLPPPDVQIVKVGFGNQKGILEITRLKQSDIKQYNVYAVPAPDQANPVCPGGIDFAATPVAHVEPQPGGGSTVKITIPNLTNGVYYCVAVQAQDQTGNLSHNITTSTETIFPEETFGITSASGETGCSLSAGTRPGRFGVMPFILALILPIGRRFGEARARRLMIALVALATMSFFPSQAHAVETTDQKWSAQFQGGFFLPTDHEIDRFLGKCCNGMYQFTFGRLWDSKYEVNLGVGIMSEGGKAIGATTGRISDEDFNFTVMPISNSFVYRADYVENQLFVPYVGVGLDYMFFRENLQSQVTKGWKFGYHAMAGLQILLEFFDPAADALEAEGINDIYLTLEGKWSQIDNFGGKGLDFSGMTFSAGLLFEF